MSTVNAVLEHASRFMVARMQFQALRPWSSQSQPEQAMSG